jgi:hypothetical protein
MNIFSKIDDTVMKGVNAGVRAYNWTTGGTKLDLSRTLLSTAPICSFMGSLSSISYFSSYTLPYLSFSGVALVISHFRQKQHEELYRRESC